MAIFCSRKRLSDGIEIKQATGREASGDDEKVVVPGLAPLEVRRKETKKIFFHPNQRADSPDPSFSRTSKG